MKRIGVWISEKKFRKLDFHLFADVCREANLEVVKIDLEKSLESQGPFDLILHKISDVMVKADYGSIVAKNQFQSFMNYIRSHADIPVIDPVENVRKLLDRARQYRLVHECNFIGDAICTPPFVELQTKDVETNKLLLKKAGVQFPLVCKPSISQCLEVAHHMAIIFNEKGLEDITPPCVAQMFINHSAVLYKIFVIGDHHFVVERPSLKNFHPGGQETIFFDSHDVSKPHSSSFLNRLDSKDMEHSPVKPDYTLFATMAHTLKLKLGMDLFGIDVIISDETRQYAVIDVNNFPGYDGIPDFFNVLLSHVQKKIVEHRSQSRCGEVASKNSTLSTMFNCANHKKEDCRNRYKIEENQNNIATSYN